MEKCLNDKIALRVLQIYEGQLIAIKKFQA